MDVFLVQIVNVTLRIKGLKSLFDLDFSPQVFRDTILIIISIDCPRNWDFYHKPVIPTISLVPDLYWDGILDREHSHISV